jgi:oligoendopeptidase F
MTQSTLPERRDVPQEYTWDLTSLYADDAAWERDLKKYLNLLPRFAEFRGTIKQGPGQLAKLLKFDSQVDRLGERLGTYGMLRTSEDQSDSHAQGMRARFQNAVTQGMQATSFIRPELLRLSFSKLKEYLAASELKKYHRSLRQIIRFKPHTLSDNEERLLAMQGEMSQAANQAFRQLQDADMRFGPIKDHEGKSLELTHATFGQLLISPKRSVREKAFRQYYAQYAAHENTLAATLAGSIHRDVYEARARNYPTSLEAALFPDSVPTSVYENLIAAVHKALPSVHRFYELRRRKMCLSDIHHYDTYVPILSEIKRRTTWDQAVSLVLDALSPLGNQYVDVLERGLRGRWCDRYPNRGKQSGAFSCGSFDGQPYILMNFKEDVFNDVFTLAHEAGHSMHSYFSAKKQPYEDYNYTIFVAEVASTFNEQLLMEHLLRKAASDQERAYLVNQEIDSLRATIIRQTMFAEFEQRTHAMAEAGEPLTVASFKSVYRGLLDQYFGPNFIIDSELELECFRIPHFYRAFYVYKYSTGLSAAIALSRRVLHGGKSELDDYLGFLSGGCSREPLELLQGAGVDMSKPEVVGGALRRFDELVDEFERLT